MNRKNQLTLKDDITFKQKKQKEKKQVKKI